jgi:hypothetical protein
VVQRMGPRAYREYKTLPVMFLPLQNLQLRDQVLVHGHLIVNQIAVVGFNHS